MSGRWTDRTRGSLATLTALAALTALAIPAARSEDSLADPERIETARDPRRLTPNVHVTASAAERRFDQLEPIRLAVQAKNVSSRYEGLPAAGMLPEGYYRIFRLRVFDAEGRFLPETHYLKVDVPRRGMPVGMSNGSAGLVFSPGQEVGGEVVANLVYDMTSPGKYTILVEYLIGRSQVIDGTKVPLVAQSEPIEVEVVPQPLRLTP